MEQCNLLSLNHISYLCRSVDDTAAFYKTILGFQEVPRPAFEFEGCWLAGHGIGLHLIHGTPKMGPRKLEPQDSHVSFTVKDIAAMEALLRKHGIEFVQQTVRHAGAVCQQVFFHDPDHNMIELQSLPRSLSRLSEDSDDSTFSYSSV